MALIGRTPTKAERCWLNTIQRLGCIVCATHFGVESPAEIHHIEGKVKPGCHFRTIPLCAGHHRSGDGAGPMLSRHPWKERWEERFGTEEELWKKVCDFVGMDPTTQQEESIK